MMDVKLKKRYKSKRMPLTQRGILLLLFKLNKKQHKKGKKDDRDNP